MDSLPRHVGGLAQALLDWRVIYWLGLHRLLLTKRDSDWRSAHPRCKRECHNCSVAVSVCRTAAGRLVWVRVRWATEEQTRVRALQKRQEICVSAWSLVVTILVSHYCLLLLRDHHHHPHDTNLSNLLSLGVPVAKPRKQSGVQKQLCWVMVSGFFFFFFFQLFFL